tara:strand:+ start:69 stop:284 length:216 start_codon:yes stop_codon:yes gene_type:complete
MGEKELNALKSILEDPGNKKFMIGTWSINFDKEKKIFQFDKCEFGGYCEERPAVINIDGEIIDKGGPIIEG